MVLGYVVSQAMWGDAWTSWGWRVHGHPMGAHGGFMGAMPASGLLVSYVWLGDQFYWIHLVGFSLIVAAIALVAWAHRRSQRRDESAGREFRGCHAYPG